MPRDRPGCFGDVPACGVAGLLGDRGMSRAIRPPKKSEWRELFRLNDDGEFVPDDGQPARAFFGYLMNESTLDGRPFSFPVAFCYGTLRSVGQPKAQALAMDACVKKYGCANGRRVNGKGQWS